MVQPTFKPTDHAQISERRHSDPPALWVGVILCSVVIHLFAFGMLRLLLMGRMESLLSVTTLVPVDVIALSPDTPLSTQATQIPSSGTPRKPIPVSEPTRRTSNPLPNRQTSSVSTPSSTRANSRPAQPYPSQSTTTNPLPNQPPISQPRPTSANPFPNQPPISQPRPTSPNPLPNQPPTSPPGSTSPNPLPNQPPISPPGPTSPNPSPKPPPISPPGPTSPNPQPGGSFRATIGGLGVTVPGKDIPTKYAQLQSGNTTQFPTDYLTVIGINTNQSLVLKAKVLIDSTGKPTILPNTAELSPGTISNAKAEQLAKQIIEKWTFSPTYMGSEPVDQAYNIELNLN